LEGTNLVYSYLDDNTVTIIPVNSNNKLEQQSPSAGNLHRCSGISSDKLDYVTSLNQAGSEGAPDCVESRSLGNQTLAIRIASAEDAPVQNSDGESNLGKDSTTEPAVLEEVIVTAQKREERQQDVPIAMTVLDPTELARNGQNRLIDYFASVPGLSVQSNGSVAGTQYLTIRGLSTGLNQNATVATVIDDVPTGSGSQIVFGNVTSPDIDPSDLARIEVLKGPQGTLYGADSLGGLIKYVTVDPSTEALSGRVEASGVGIPVGGLGYAVRGAMNIPASDTVAIRVSGFTRRDPGFTENLTSGQTNVNSADVYGGHIAVLWRPSEDVSLKVSGLIQQTDGNGASYFNAQIGADGSVQPTLGYLKYTGQAFADPYTTQEQLYSATLKAKVGEAELVSVTGYSDNKLHAWFDLGTLFGFLTPPGNSGWALTGDEQIWETKTFSQELRLSSTIGHWLDWLVGGFYTHQNSPNSQQNIFAADPATGAIGNLLLNGIHGPFTLSESAIFSALTFHITSRFDLQVGGRQSWNKQAYDSASLGVGVPDLYGVPSPFVEPSLHATGDAFTYLVTPQFKVSQDLMIYARAASGYRIGGPNLNYGLPGVPQDYKPDRTTNYELGIKGAVLEHRLNFDVAAYYIDWRDFQISSTTPGGMFYEANAGTAKSKGVEFSVQATPTRGLTITGQASYNNAVLTEDLPPGVVAQGAYGPSGTQLPYSIRWSGGVTANQDFPIANEWKGFIGGALTYVGLRYGEFALSPTTPRPQYPEYATLNLRAGARSESWLFNLYVNNVADKRGIAGAQQTFAVGVTGGYYGTIIQPRTVGLSVSKTF